MCDPSIYTGGLTTMHYHILPLLWLQWDRNIIKGLVRFREGRGIGRFGQIPLFSGRNI